MAATAIAPIHAHNHEAIHIIYDMETEKAALRTQSPPRRTTANTHTNTDPLSDSCQLNCMFNVSGSRTHPRIQLC